MIERFKTRLIEDWRKAYKLWSVRLSLLGGALMAAWPTIPQDIRDDIPGQRWIACGMFALVILSRLVAQGGSNAGK